MNSDTSVDTEIKKKKVRIFITLILGLLLSAFCGSSLLYIFSARGEGYIYFMASNECTGLGDVGATTHLLPSESLHFLYSENLAISLEYNPGELIPSTCSEFNFTFSSKPSSLTIGLTSYNPKKQKKSNPIKEGIDRYITLNDAGNYDLKLPVALIKSIVGKEYFLNEKKTSSTFKFIFNLEGVVREPTFSRRTMYGTLIANSPTFENVSINLPNGARPLPFSPVSHWTPSGFRHSNPKYWKELREFSILPNDNQTNMSVAFDFPEKERIEKTLLMILSTLFGVGISAMIEAFLSLGTASLVGLLALRPQILESNNKSNGEPNKANISDAKNPRG